MTKSKRPSFKTKEIKLGFEVWSQISKTHKPTKEDIGKHVWVAGEFKTKQRILKAVHKKGERMWPEGGFEVLEVDKGVIRYYPIQKCRLHPNELKYEKRKRA